MLKYYDYDIFIKLYLTTYLWIGVKKNVRNDVSESILYKQIAIFLSNSSRFTEA